LRKYLPILTTFAFARFTCELTLLTRNTFENTSENISTLNYFGILVSICQLNLKSESTAELKFTRGQIFLFEFKKYINSCKITLFGNISGLSKPIVNYIIQLLTPGFSLLEQLSSPNLPLHQ